MIAWNLENKTCFTLIPQSVSRDFVGSAGIWKYLKCNSIALFFHCTEFLKCDLEDSKRFLVLGAL